MRICKATMSAIAKIKAVLSATQYDLAVITGKNQATVSRWERGECLPNIQDLEKLRAECLRRGIPWADEYWVSDAAA